MRALIIAEKPSLAREIQAMLEAQEGEKFYKKGGFFESNKYFLSWFYGHLLKAKKPDEIDARYKKWSLEDLPILPEAMQYKYTSGERGTAKQGKLLAKLAKESKLIINACDPDREGEGIFRIWYRYETIDKPVKRFWSPSLALVDLGKAWSTMKSASEYDLLGQAQEMRSYSDYIVGMNGSRAYTLRAGELLPIGRVKTATLALIVKRDMEVENFKESFSYKLVGTWQGLEFELLDSPPEKEALEKIMQMIRSESFFVSDIKKERKATHPPKPFSMPDLQAQANKLFDYELDVTLALAQSLYEKKLITYPRTDSPYLPATDLGKYIELFKQVASDPEKALQNPKTPAFIKNTQDPHSAIIITGVEAARAGLNPSEEKIYQLIKSRFITSFLKPYIYDETRIEIVGPSGYAFRNIFKNTIDQGFKTLHKDTEASAKGSVLEAMVDTEILKTQNVPFMEMNIKEIEKKRPSYFTPATLLKAMINVSKDIANKDLKEVLRNVEGLGTAATRDQYPKDLEHDGYVFRKNKFIISNLKGRRLIGVIHPKLKDPVFTAEFEADLNKIEKGELATQAYKSAIQAFVREIIDVPDLKNNFVDDDFKCPKCQGKIREFAWGWACMAGKEKCGFTISGKIAGKKITPTNVKQLLKDKKTKSISGFASTKSGQKFTAFLVLDAEHRVKFSFK